MCFIGSTFLSWCWIKKTSKYLPSLFIGTYLNHVVKCKGYFHKVILYWTVLIVENSSTFSHKYFNVIHRASCQLHIPYLLFMSMRNCFIFWLATLFRLLMLTVKISLANLTGEALVQVLSQEIGKMCHCCWINVCCWYQHKLYARTDAPRLLQLLFLLCVSLGNM
jgi:hypothetical protein